MSVAIDGKTVEGAGIPSGTTIASVDGDTQITLSATATASFRVHLGGPGNGATTLNLPAISPQYGGLVCLKT